jgi:hypothetical protein
MAVITEERLQDIFSSPRWQEHFTTLSRALGFSLGVYSREGRPLIPHPGPSPFCAPLMTAAGFPFECAACHRRALDVLVTRVPRCYHCNARVMNFALPVSYLDDRAVILGQGFFASYDDYRVYRDLLRTYAPDAAFPVATALRFTTESDAKSVCQLIDRSVNLLLRKLEETISLKRKFTNLKGIVSSLWGMAGADAEPVRENFTRKLMSFIDIKAAAILALDRGQDRYVATHHASANGMALELDRSHHVVRSLQDDQPYVVTAEMAVCRDTGTVEKSGVLARYYFPIWVNRSLKHILLVHDGLLVESDLQSILSFCKQAGLAIENGQLQRDLSRKFSRIAAVAELTLEISSIDCYESLLRSILDQSAELLMAGQGSLMVLDPETDALQLKAKMGASAGAMETVRIPKGQGIAGRVAQEGEAIVVENVESDPRVRRKNREHYKTPSFLSVPLKIGDRTIGVLNLADKTTGEAFDGDDLSLIQFFRFVGETLLRMVRHMDTVARFGGDEFVVILPETDALLASQIAERIRQEIASL